MFNFRCLEALCSSCGIAVAVVHQIIWLMSLTYLTSRKTFRWTIKRACSVTCLRSSCATSGQFYSGSSSVARDWPTGTSDWLHAKLIVLDQTENPPTPLWRRRRAYWGAHSNTKCSMTFVNIAVAISALAGGGKNGFAPRPAYGGVFDFFRGFLGVWAQEGIETEFWVILVAFRQWKNGQKWKKTLYIARFCKVFGCQSIENSAKTSVLDWRYSKKRVNYRMLDWKPWKNTVKHNVLQGFLIYMLDLATGIGTGKNWRKHSK